MERVETTRQQITRLKWLTTVVPTLAILLYEVLRHQVLDRWLPPVSGHLVVALWTLLLAYGFSEVVFGVMQRLQAQAMARQREVVALRAVMQERERLSRELHDGLAQLVAYLSVRLDTVIDLVRADRRDDALAELERLRGVADDLYADVRESIAGLRSRVAERGLLAVVQDYVDEFEERHRIAVTLEAESLPERLPPLVGLQLFRIVQEALANVRKHADARRAWVALRGRGGDRLEVIVADDGKGFDVDALARAGRRSFGLATMRERAEGLGGSFRVESAPGRGTRVVVAVPLVENAHDALATVAR
ncbi:MAG TPA: sensor histidine kinase [Chloroflexota bacterium]